MAGKLCIGELANNSGAANLRESVAFCEGMAHRARGPLGNPVTENPHKETSNPSRISWNHGYVLAHDYAGGTIPKEAQGCCNVSGIVPT